MSMKAALASLAARKPAEEGRRMAVLTDMLELARESPRHHAEPGRARSTRPRCDLVYLRRTAA